MKLINSWLRNFSIRQDIILAFMLLIAIFMMIIPLPTILVDLLIAINLTLSIMLLMMALYIREPMEFSAFPAVLLITTLYRLALTISTSRLILLQHDAGELVYAFGNFAVGGSLAVGLIVFSIITIVQFIVITKGSERVAEVSARFSLDGMPGKQMSIDGDMRAGIIDATEARHQRIQVQKESQLYGAMDGAMKFVKGDAIASIIVVLVNIFGGICVGVFVHGMSASEAGSVYTILSVGDGLVTQIPALLISVAAGIIVTRVPGEVRVNLAAELSEQILRHRNALWLVAVVLMLFSALPGFPVLIFLPIAGLIAIGAYFLTKKHNVKHNEYDINANSNNKKSNNDNVIIGATPLMVHLHPDLVKDQLFSIALSELRVDKLENFGVPLPEINFKMDKTLLPNQFKLCLFQESVLEIEMKAMALLDTKTPLVSQSELHETLSINGRMLQWISEDKSSSVSTLGIKVFKGYERIIHIISLALERHSSEFIGVQETRFLMDQMEQRYAELVKELQRQLPVSRVADVLQRLVAENISIRDLRSIFEALVEWAPREKDPVMLTEYARLSLRRHIIGRQRNGQSWINAWIIGGNIEQMIRESSRQTSAGSYSALSAEENELILDEIRNAVNKNRDVRSVLVTTIDIRRFVRKLIEKEMFDVPVLSFQELEDEAELKVLGHIDLLGKPYAKT